MNAPGVARHPFPDSSPWHAVADAVLALEAHQPLEIARERLPHPRQCGFYASSGLDRTCLHHYRLALPDGRGLHVHVHRQRYLVHWDRVDPSVSVLRHFWHDVTRALGRSVRRIRMEAVSLAARPLQMPSPEPEPVQVPPQG